MQHRLRTLLFIGFTVVAAIPVGLLSWWVNSSALAQEYKAVEEKHLLVAKNLTNALSRYAVDVKDVFSVAHSEIRHGQNTPSDELKKLFSGLEMWRICQLRADGSIHVYFSDPKAQSGDLGPLTEEQKTLAMQSPVGVMSFLPVTSSTEQKPVLILVYPTEDGELTIGELGTDYFLSLQRAISFGKLGHAAIVDQAGNVLAHPKESWVKEHKNIAAIDPVKLMMAGEQGVSYFYSPAVKAEMVAGYTVVPETGWGAMIPQPLSELKEHASQLIQAALLISFLGILLSLYFAWWLSGIVATPIGQVARLAQRITHESVLGELLPPPSSAPREAFELVESFNNMVEQITHKTNELTFLSEHDPLTGLPNRTLLKSYLTGAIREASKTQRDFSLLFLDLDEFKEVNDNLGHNFGDIMLKDVAKRLRTVVGQQGLVSRLGGDEFAIVLPDDGSAELANSLSDVLVKSISEPFRIGEHEIYISTSIGIARCPRDALDTDRLLRCADLAMYAAKRAPDTNYLIYSDVLHKTLSERKALELELRLALEKQQFTLHYQPRVDANTGMIKGFEALIRWQHPERELLLPSDFFEEIERNQEIIIQLGEWVIQQACMDQKRFEQAGFANIKISINLSERQFHAANLLNYIDTVFAQHGANPAHFEFEVTESLAMQRPTSVSDILLEMRKRGFFLSIDDFGTGYSSLERLKNLPIDTIKIDKSFSQGIGSDIRDSAIVTHILNLAKGLDMEVVLEGVETLQQLSFIQQHSSAAVQGFVYSQAVPWQGAVQLLSCQPMSPVELKRL